MHYYSHNIADYRKDTGWLCLLQHGIYRQLLDTYYLSEKPLPADLAKLSLIICANTKKELDAMKQVLEFFFVLTDEGFSHKRCDDEINIFHTKKEQKKSAANSRWAKREAPENKGDNVSSIGASAMRTHSMCNANGMLTNNHKPITNNQEPIEKHSALKFDEFWKLYPNATAKKKCLEKWQKNKLDEIADLIIEDVRRKSNSVDWQKEGGKYIPMSITYINQERWNDTKAIKSKAGRGLVV